MQCILPTRVFLWDVSEMMYSLSASCFFSGFDCRETSCTTDCPTQFNEFSNKASSPNFLFHLQNSPANIANDRQSHKKINLSQCCRKCKCVADDGASVSNGTAWLSPNDPCSTHICIDGDISTHISLCSALPCPLEYHLWTSGQCCPTCDSKWASFCAEDTNCDIVCQYGFVTDFKRGCDLCKCVRKYIDATMTSTLSTALASNDDATQTIHFNFYLDSTNNEMKTLIGIAIASCIVVVPCFAGIAWYFHRKVYKKVPLISLNYSSV